MRRICRTFSCIGMLVFLATAGCSYYRPIQILAANQPGAVKGSGRLVEGRSCQGRLLMIIPLGKGNLAREALDEAKAAAGTDTLTDVTVDGRDLIFLPFYMSSCTIVHGLASK